jgi:hypothetical protein
MFARQPINTVEQKKDALKFPAIGTRQVCPAASNP